MSQYSEILAASIEVDPATVAKVVEEVTADLVSILCIPGLMVSTGEVSGEEFSLLVANALHALIV